MSEEEDVDVGAPVAYPVHLYPEFDERSGSEDPHLRAEEAEADVEPLGASSGRGGLSEPLWRLDLASWSSDRGEADVVGVPDSGPSHKEDLRQGLHLEHSGPSDPLDAIDDDGDDSPAERDAVLAEIEQLRKRHAWMRRKKPPDETVVETGDYL